MTLTILVIILFVITVSLMIYYGLLHGKYEMTKAHELGHAKIMYELNQFYKSNFPIYIMLYKDKDQIGWAGKATCYSLSKSVDSGNFESIQKVSKAGILAEYEEVHKYSFTPLYKFCRNIAVKYEEISNENSDGYYNKHPEKFVYKNIKYFVTEKKELISNPKSRVELYLYTDNKLRKIKYKEDLPESLNFPYKFEFIQDKENSF